MTPHLQVVSVQRCKCGAAPSLLKYSHRGEGVRYYAAIFECKPCGKSTGSRTTNADDSYHNAVEKWNVASQT